MAPVWCHTACWQGATCPPAPEAPVGAQGAVLWLGLGGTGRRFLQWLVPPWAPPPLLPGQVGVGGRKETCPPTQVRYLVTLCFSPRAWASGFEHRYWL